MKRRRKVMFLCTGNCCRSQMAEAMLRHADPVNFESLSAGSNPAGFIHPLVPAVLEYMNIPLLEQRSKGSEEFIDVDLDVVITVCDNAAEECPTWPRATFLTHWPLPDPSFHPGTAEEQWQFALAVASRLRAKIAQLVALDFDRTGPAKIQTRLDHIGQM